MNCRFCGVTLPEGAQFCGECGRAVPVPASTTPTPRRRPEMPPVGTAPTASPLAFSSEPDPEPSVRSAPHIPESAFSCPQCGEQISPVDVFCGECGFVLSGVALLAAGDSRDTAAIDPLPADYDPDSLGDLDDFGAGLEGGDEGRVAGEHRDEPVDAVAGEAGELTEIVGSASIAEGLEPVREPAHQSEPEVAQRLVRDSVISFFAPGPRDEMPDRDERPTVGQAVREDLSEPASEPIPLVEPLPFREPAAAEVERPARERPASDVEPVTPKILRKVPDPFPWGNGPGSGGVDLEATRAVIGGQAEERFVLQFSTGESVTVSGAGLVGRNPASQPGEFVDQLVTIFDAGKSVSKTHLEFGQESGRFWVSDRYSTNGSTVRQPETDPKRCDPGRRYFIARGTRVDIGEQFFVVS